MDLLLAARGSFWLLPEASNATCLILSELDDFISSLVALSGIIIIYFLLVLGCSYIELFFLDMRIWWDYNSWVSLILLLLLFIMIYYFISLLLIVIRRICHILLSVFLLWTSSSIYNWFLRYMGTTTMHLMLFIVLIGRDIVHPILTSFPYFWIRYLCCPSVMSVCNLLVE